MATYNEGCVKSSIAAWRFDSQPVLEIKDSRKRIVRGFVDQKRVYFLELRDVFNQLIESTTFTDIKKLKTVL